MDRSDKQIVDRLGATGLGRVLDDLLDTSQLVRLANACGLRYPGMRTQSQSRERLLSDLVDRGIKRAENRKAILRTAHKQIADAVKEWRTLSTEDRAKRLQNERFLLTNGRLGVHLLLAASEPDALGAEPLAGEMAQRYLIRLASNGGGDVAADKADRELARVKRQVTTRENKIRHLETQLSKARDQQKAAKRDLIQRKGELAESRMLVERLRRELAAAQTVARDLPSPKSDAVADKAVAALSKTVRKLAAEQRKLAHAVDRRASAESPALPAKSLNELKKSVEALRGELRGKADERGEALLRQIDELRQEIRSGRETRRASPSASRRKRSKGASRIGVFVDVQNVYYGARRLKGKLDFDKLLEAAVGDRRLIKATAYVVESKEIDQSQFIKMLQHRAIEVRRKNLQVRADGSMKGDWDMDLAIDILDAAPGLDVVVLVSGDGDFTSLVKRVKAMGPRVEVIGFPRHTAKALLESADSFQPLDRRFMIYAKPRKKPTEGTTPKKSDGKAANEAKAS